MINLWFGKIRTGLPNDSKAKHIKAMGKSVFLYLHLHMDANHNTGILVRKYETISRMMGMPLSTIKKWAANLNKNGYIVTSSKGDCTEFKITNYNPERSIQNGTTEASRSTQNGTTVNSRSTKNDQEKYQKRSREVPKLARSTQNGTSLNGCNIKDLWARSTQSDTSSKIFNREVIDKKTTPVSKVPKKGNPSSKKKTNPEIKEALDFFHTNYFRVHGFKPETGGMAAKVLERLLVARPIGDIKNLIIAYLQDHDGYIAERAWPINLLPSRVDALILKGALKVPLNTNRQEQESESIHTRFREITSNGHNPFDARELSRKHNDYRRKYKVSALSLEQQTTLNEIKPQRSKV